MIAAGDRVLWQAAPATNTARRALVMGDEPGEICTIANASSASITERQGPEGDPSGERGGGDGARWRPFRLFRYHVLIGGV